MTRPPVPAGAGVPWFVAQTRPKLTPGPPLPAEADHPASRRVVADLTAEDVPGPRGVVGRPGVVDFEEWAHVLAQPVALEIEHGVGPRLQVLNQRLLRRQADPLPAGGVQAPVQRLAKPAPVVFPEQDHPSS